MEEVSCAVESVSGIAMIIFGDRRARSPMLFCFLHMNQNSYDATVNRSVAPHPFGEEIKQSHATREGGFAFQRQIPRYKSENTKMNPPCEPVLTYSV